MPKIQIVTDSTAIFCEPDYAQRHGLTIMPLTLQLGPATFKEGSSLTPAQFQRELSQSRHMPVAVPPTAEAFAATYHQLLSNSSQIISIHVSSQLNQTTQHARLGSDTLRGRCKIEVIDSLSISAGLGVLVETAVNAAAADQPFEEVVRLVRKKIARQYSIFFVETLDYLAQAGQVSRAQAILSAMLGLKPFLSLEEGRLLPTEKARSRQQAIEKLIEFVAEFSNLERLAILYGSAEPTTETRLVRERLLTTFPAQTEQNWLIQPYGPTLATLLGPHALGVMVCENETELLE